MTLIQIKNVHGKLRESKKVIVDGVTFIRLRHPYLVNLWASNGKHVYQSDLIELIEKSNTCRYESEISKEEEEEIM